MGFSIVFSDSASDSTVSSVVCSVMNPCLSDLEKRRAGAGWNYFWELFRHGRKMYAVAGQRAPGLTGTLV